MAISLACADATAQAASFTSAPLIIVIRGLRGQQIVQIPDVFTSIREFLKLESSGGILLMGAAALALVVANSPLQAYYAQLLRLPGAIRLGPLDITKPLILWVNDGLMAIFFCLVGLEVKRELREGELSSLRKVSLPALGALGGMIAPALIYWWLNAGDAQAIHGWAIPTTTDIAFALGVLMLLGRRVPSGLKVFLVSLAIFDDLAAILIIAIFYSHGLSLTALAIAGACLILLLLLNLRGVVSIVPYLLIGMVMWIAVLKSGVHATLAGIVLALFIPIKNPRRPEHSPLRELEHDLHPSVAYVILPLFAFVNAGVNLKAASALLIHPVPLGIVFGLFLGKQLGVFAICWLSVRLGLTKLPESVGFRELYGVALLCGVGFTMSLFISTLAFHGMNADYIGADRLAILIGSLLSGVSGYLWLGFTLPRTGDRTGQAQWPAPGR